MSRKLLGSHNRSWIWGRHAVWATLDVGRWTPLELVTTPRCLEALRQSVHRLAAERQIPLEELTDAELARRCRADDHQGLAARMPEFPYTDFESLLAQSCPPTAWLVLDGIQDSFNVGAIIRSSVELGIEVVLLGAAGQSGVNSQVVRSSAGAVNHLPIVRVPELSTAMQRLMEAGIIGIAASEKSSRLLESVDLTRPVAIVIGNEAHGVSADVLSHCDEQVRIPISNRVGSLNAAVAAGIFCYELVRQRTPKVTPTCP